MRPHHTAPLALVVAAACAGSMSASGGSAPIAGSTAALQPRIVSSTAMRSARVSLRMELPVHSYVTTLLVLPKRGVALLTQSEAGDPVPVALDSGRHRLVMQEAEIPFSSTIDKAAMEFTETYARQYADAKALGPFYTIVVATEKPIPWQSVKIALDPVNLDGSPSEVLARIATAVGVQSSGKWAAASMSVANTR